MDEHDAHNKAYPLEIEHAEAIKSFFNKTLFQIKDSIQNCMANHSECLSTKFLCLIGYKKIKFVVFLIFFFSPLPIYGADVNNDSKDKKEETKEEKEEGPPKIGNFA